MIEKHLEELLFVAGDTSQEFPVRKQALQELGLSTNKVLIPHLHRLIQRPRPGPEMLALNWDPAAGERVLDLYIIAALHNLGDDSQIEGIAKRVAMAGRILQGPDDELVNAATVILKIGRIEPIQQVLTLINNERDEVVTNAVRILQLLRLPSPPSGGPVNTFPNLSVKVSFEITRLCQELETIVRLSNGSISLSNGVRAHIEKHDYERGKVRREDIRLSDIITQDLDDLGFSYYLTEYGVIICTFREAGYRWQTKWPEYMNHLIYDPTSQRFIRR